MRVFKTNKPSLILAVLILALTTLPIISVVGETYQHMYIDFTIQPSQPEIIGKDSFSLNPLNEYIYGIPEVDAVGSRSDSGTYFLEMWSTGRLEVYILDSSGPIGNNQYMDYVGVFVGNAPDDYNFLFICDGYLKVEFYGGSINPKLVIFSDGVDVTGNYLWTAGLDAIIYQPYYLRIMGSDRSTNDTIRIFNLNATVSTYLLDDDQYSTWSLIPGAEPSSFSSVDYDQDVTETNLTYTSEIDMDYHLIVWHEEFYGTVNGTLVYEYTYYPSFFETYWSLFLVVGLLVILILMFAFQKVVLPPIVWTGNKLKYYLISIPWRELKATFADIVDEFGAIWSRARGVAEEEVLIDEEKSSHKKWLLTLLAVIGFLGLHRYMVGKIASGIVFTCTGGFFIFGWIIDLIAITAGCFKDGDEKLIVEWK